MSNTKSSKWRQRFRVHPAADIFPMMSDAELTELGADIVAHGLKTKIDVRRINLPEDDGTFRVGGNHVLEVRDGRNRLEAAERVGIDLGPCCFNEINPADPVAHIISANIHRRHLTKQERADAIVAAAKMAIENKPGQAGPVSDGEMPDIPPRLDRRGGRGKKNPIKERALKLNKALPKEQQTSERTIKRSIAKTEGRTPKPKPEPKRYTPRPMPKPRSGKPVLGLEAARRHYRDQCAGVGVDLDAEINLITDALRELAEKAGGRP